MANVGKILKGSLSKISLTIFAAIFFALVIFPYDDLADLVSGQVAKATNNQSFVQFKHLALRFFPLPQVHLEKVIFESLKTPTLSAESVEVRPSITGIIQKKPFGNISLGGFLGGEVEASVGKGSVSEKGIEKLSLDVSAKKLSLSDIRDLAELPMLLKGQLQLDSKGQLDATFEEQPDIEMNLLVNKFELPATVINLGGLPLSLPELKLSSLNLKGRLSGGQFLVETIKLGNDSDDLSGTIKGKLDMKIMKNENGKIFQQFGAYNFNAELKVKKSFQPKATLFLTFIDQFKSPGPGDSDTYKFSVSANMFGIMPAMTAPR